MKLVGADESSPIRGTVTGEVRESWGISQSRVRVQWKVGSPALEKLLFPPKITIVIPELED